MNKPGESSNDLKVWVAMELQMMRELCPGKEMSDDAARIMLALAVDAAEKVGRERFHAALVKAMDVSGQFRPTIGLIRRMSGVSPRMDFSADAVAAAWALVTTCVARHMGYDGEGHAYLTYRIATEGGRLRQEGPPPLPAGVLQAVRSMGGWTALAEAHPAYWSQRFETFKQLLRLSPDEVNTLTSPPNTSLVTK